jgi:hypothetical protein
VRHIRAQFLVKRFLLRFVKQGFLAVFGIAEFSCAARATVRYARPLSSAISCSVLTGVASAALPNNVTSFIFPPY